MALVGDLIFRVRSKIPDLPQVLAAPVNFSVVSQTATGGVISAGAWYIQVCYLTLYGVSLPSPEQIVTIAGNSVYVTLQDVFASSTGMPPGAIGFRVYMGRVSGGENAFSDYINQTLLNQVSVLGMVASGTPPGSSTAYTMDTDGQQFGASTLYDWLNDALVNISRAVGGLLDYCGVPTTVGQPLYVLPGEWLKITDIWYGGYWIQGGQRANFFRRNSVTTAVLDGASVSVFTDKQVMEVSYQPDRSSGVTATSADMGLSDASVSVVNPGVFLLPFGFAQIGTEIVAYSSTSLSGLVRGLGSTVAQAWPSGTVVKELSLFWCGNRIFNTKYVPGQAGVTLAAPIGWESIIPMWMLAQAKKSELDMQAASTLEKDCLQQAKDWMLGNRGVVSRVQVGGTGVGMTFSATVAGGLIIP